MPQPFYAHGQLSKAGGPETGTPLGLKCIVDQVSEAVTHSRRLCDSYFIPVGHSDCVELCR